MKKILSGLMALCLAQTLRACASSDTGKREAVQILKGQTDGLYQLSTGTELPGQTLWTDGEITVCLGGITGTPELPERIPAVENGSQETVFFSVNFLSFNGWQVTSRTDPSTVLPRSVERITVSACHLTMDWPEPDDIWKAALGFRRYNGDYDILAGEDHTFSTAAPENPDPYSCDGPVLAETEEVRVQAVSLSNESDCTMLRLYVENNSDDLLSLSFSDARTDSGREVRVSCITTIYPHQKCLPAANLYDPDPCQDLILEAGTELTFVLEVYDKDVWGCLFRDGCALTAE